MRSFFLAIQLSFRNLGANLVRTFVTLIGIVISIAAIIVVLSAGGSVKEYILGEVGSFGSSTIQIEVRVPSGTANKSPSGADQAVGASEITTMKMRDAERIARLDNVSAYYASVIGQGLGQLGSVRKQSIIWGATPGITEVDKNIKLAEGVFYGSDDEDGAARKIVLGSDAAKTFFGTRRAVGEKIKIKGQSYTVIGVLQSRGASFGFNFDEMIYMPLKTTQTFILGTDHVSAITVSAKNEAMMNDTAEAIRRILRDNHKIDDPKFDDFQVMTIKEAQDTISKVFGAVNILLLAVASISLVVGGVGIMNVMFVALEERMAEIGLRKALGAKPQDILRQFLVESTTIATLGGLIGITLGIGMLFGLLFILSRFGFVLPSGIGAQTIGIAVGFSVGAGLFFGVYPAWRASKVEPVVAMRQE